jgi:hypothetical protein
VLKVSLAAAYEESISLKWPPKSLAKVSSQTMKTKISFNVRCILNPMISKGQTYDGVT